MSGRGGRHRCCKTKTIMRSGDDDLDFSREARCVGYKQRGLRVEVVRQTGKGGMEDAG